MAHPGDDPNSGYAKMYTGKPSRPGKTQVQIGYGTVEGDGVGYTDTADTIGGTEVKKGSVVGKRNVAEESTKTQSGFGKKK
jgi:hypothetical protein